MKSGTNNLLSGASLKTQTNFWSSLRHSWVPTEIVEWSLLILKFQRRSSSSTLNFDGSIHEKHLSSPYDRPARRQSFLVRSTIHLLCWNDDLSFVVPRNTVQFSLNRKFEIPGRLVKHFILLFRWALAFLNFWKKTFCGV